MKEFSKTIEKELTFGLRRHEKVIRNKFKLFELYNLEPMEGGLHPLEPVVNPFNTTELSLAGLELDWPFPQLFIGTSAILLASANRVYEVNPNDFSFNQLTTYDADTPGTEKGIEVGGPWQFFDLGKNWFLTNGTDTVFYYGKDEMLGNAPKVYVKAGMPFQTGCYHKGRVLFGGFDYNQFWNTAWQSIWDTWQAYKLDTKISDTIIKPEGDIKMPVGENWLWWSSIGGGDVTFLFFPQLAQEGAMGEDDSGYGDTDPLFMEFLKGNESGFTALPFIGTLRLIKPMGDYIIAYGDTRVLAIRPVPAPSPTYSIIPIPKLNRVGVESGVAVAGDDSHHVFLDKAGFLWELKADLSVVPLGYREFLFDFVGQAGILAHSQNPHDISEYGRFYLGRDGENFVLNKQGLFETGQLVTSVDYFSGATIGVCETLEDGEDEARIGVDTFDFSEEGTKTLESIHLFMDTLRYDSNEGLLTSVAVDYKWKKDMEFRTTAYKPVNEAGWIHFPVSGIEFRVRVKAQNFARFNLGSIRIDVKFSDRRFRRAVELT